MKIYLAGPITGMSYDNIVAKINHKREILEGFGYVVCHPIMAKEAIRSEVEIRPSGYSSPVSTNHAIFGRDKWMVLNSDIILVDFTEDGNRISIDSCMEMAWGNLLNKHIVAIIPEESIHKHAFVLETADIIYETVDEALQYLGKLASNN